MGYNGGVRNSRLGCGICVSGGAGKVGARMDTGEIGKRKRMKREVLYGAHNADYGAGAGGGG